MKPFRRHRLNTYSKIAKLPDDFDRPAAKFCLPKKFNVLKQKDNMIRLHQERQRSWLRKHGKDDFIDFNNQERKELRKVFRELDHDNVGALGANELFEPLLALGLVESKEQVMDMIRKVDFDSSGLIEFDEFLKVLINAKNNNGENPLADFFRKLASKKIFQEYSELPFKLLMSGKRREIMLQSYIGSTPSARDKGLRILNAFAEEINKEQETFPKQLKVIQKKENMLERLKHLNISSSQIRARSADPMFITSVSRVKSCKPVTRQKVLFGNYM